MRTNTLFFAPPPRPMFFRDLPRRPQDPLLYLSANRFFSPLAPQNFFFPFDASAVLCYPHFGILDRAFALSPIPLNVNTLSRADSLSTRNCRSSSMLSFSRFFRVPPSRLPQPFKCFFVLDCPSVFLDFQRVRAPFFFFIMGFSVLVS